MPAASIESTDISRIDAGDRQSPSPLCSPAIDRDHLARYTLGNSEIESEILELFCEQSMKLLAQLKSAETQADWSFATHSLKGSARAVGAWEVGREAEGLERLEPQAEPAKEGLVRLEAALADAMAAATAR